jgi:hypothetical protein
MAVTLKKILAQLKTAKGIIESIDKKLSDMRYETELSEEEIDYIKQLLFDASDTLREAIDIIEPTAKTSDEEALES